MYKETVLEQLKNNFTQELFETILLQNSDCYDDSYIDDCNTIKDAIFMQLGIEISLKDAADFWEDRSDQWSAGWLQLDSDNAIVKYFKEYMERLIDKTYLSEKEENAPSKKQILLEQLEALDPKGNPDYLKIKKELEQCIKEEQEKTDKFIVAAAELVGTKIWNGISGIESALRKALTVTKITGEHNEKK